MADSLEPKKSYSPILISIFCIGIILFILFTQCEVSNIKLKPKDASLILIILALLAYINNYQMLFLLLLGMFLFVYFAPNELINKLFSPFMKKKEKKSIIKKNIEIDDQISVDIPDMNTDNEITLDTDIEIDDNIDDIEHNEVDIEGPEEDLYLTAKKKIN